MRFARQVPWSEVEHRNWTFLGTFLIQSSALVDSRLTIEVINDDGLDYQVLILEAVPGGEPELLLRGVGWQADVWAVGSAARVPADPETTLSRLGIRFERHQT